MGVTCIEDSGSSGGDDDSGSGGRCDGGRYDDVCVDS